MPDHAPTLIEANSDHQAGTDPNSGWGRTRKVVPQSAVVLIGRPPRQPKSEARPEASSRFGAPGSGTVRNLAADCPDHEASVMARRGVLVHRTMPRKHVLMLALAAEILVIGLIFGSGRKPGVFIVDDVIFENHSIS